jgi:hypothetical protein
LQQQVAVVVRAAGWATAESVVAVAAAEEVKGSSVAVQGQLEPSWVVAGAAAGPAQVAGVQLFLGGTLFSVFLSPTGSKLEQEPAPESNALEQQQIGPAFSQHPPQNCQIISIVSRRVKTLNEISRK